MPTPLDLLFVALFAVVFPLWDYFISWPSFRRKSEANPDRARKQLWITSIVCAWPLVAVGAALWMSNARPWSALGFSVPEGWRLWVSIVLVLLLVTYIVQATAAIVRDPKIRANVRQQSGKVASLMPQNRSEMVWFGGVSLTAGFCEEFLFRGYLIWSLAPWLGWWGAAAVSVLIFAFGHAYQGWSGIVGTGIAGVFFTLTVALFGSLWPAIILHFLWDLAMGLIAWLALREEQAVDRTVEA